MSFPACTAVCRTCDCKAAISAPSAGRCFIKLAFAAVRTNIQICHDIFSFILTVFVLAGTDTAVPNAAAATFTALRFPSRSNSLSQRPWQRHSGSRLQLRLWPSCSSPPLVRLLRSSDQRNPRNTVRMPDNAEQTAAMMLHILLTSLVCLCNYQCLVRTT